MHRSILFFALLVFFFAPRTFGREEVERILKDAQKMADEGEYDHAVSILQSVFKEHPEDWRILLAFGKVSHLQGQEFLNSSDPALGSLALSDAKGWYERAIRIRPDWPEAFQLLGQVAADMQDWNGAAEAWQKASALNPGNGESLFQLGYSLMMLGRFQESIEAFEKGEERLGPDPRIALYCGVSHANLSQVSQAEKWLLKLIRNEVALERPGSAEMAEGLVWLWRVHAREKDFAAAEAVFTRLSEEFPDLSFGHWYKGYALLELNKAEDAVRAFQRVTQIVPEWLEGWKQLGAALVKAGDFEGAERVLEKELALEPASQAAQELLFEIAGGLVAEGKHGEAVNLFTRMETSFPDDRLLLLERRADILFKGGRMEEAIAEYRKISAVDPSAAEVRIKEQKAVTALLKRGERPEKLVPLRQKPGAVPRGAGGVIFDFENPSVFVRAEGKAAGFRSEGSFVLERTGTVEPLKDLNLQRGMRGGGQGGPPAGQSQARRRFGGDDSPESMANMSMTFIPTMDTRPFTHIRFDVLGPKGTHLLLLAKDCYDEFGMNLLWIRLRHRTPVELTGEWQTVTLPLDGFETPFESRPIPMNRARLRMLIFEIGQSLEKNLTLADRIQMDIVALVGEDGKAKVLADFEGDPSEAFFVGEGAATPFAPTLFSLEQVETFQPDPNTYVNPDIFGDGYEPEMVHSGRGSYRLALQQGGGGFGRMRGGGPGRQGSSTAGGQRDDSQGERVLEASGVLRFNPDRSFRKASAITFWAKGLAGGEKIRITIRDALDEDLENPAFASAPRMENEEQVLDGLFTLSREWAEFRIPCTEFPDVDFRSLLEIRFHFGTPEGNKLGTTIFIDDIRWE